MPNPFPSMSPQTMTGSDILERYTQPPPLSSTDIDPPGEIEDLLWQMQRAKKRKRRTERRAERDKSGRGSEEKLTHLDVELARQKAAGDQSEEQRTADAEAAANTPEAKKARKKELAGNILQTIGDAMVVYSSKDPAATASRMLAAKRNRQAALTEAREARLKEAEAAQLLVNAQENAALLGIAADADAADLAAKFDRRLQLQGHRQETRRLSQQLTAEEKAVKLQLAARWKELEATFGFEANKAMFEALQNAELRGADNTAELKRLFARSVLDSTKDIMPYVNLGGTAVTREKLHEYIWITSQGGKIGPELQETADLVAEAHETRRQFAAQAAQQELVKNELELFDFFTQRTDRGVLIKWVQSDFGIGEPGTELGDTPVSAIHALELFTADATTPQDKKDIIGRASDRLDEEELEDEDTSTSEPKPKGSQMITSLPYIMNPGDPKGFKESAVSLERTAAHKERMDERGTRNYEEARRFGQQSSKGAAVLSTPSPIVSPELVKADDRALTADAAAVESVESLAAGAMGTSKPIFESVAAVDPSMYESLVNLTTSPIGHPDLKFQQLIDTFLTQARHTSSLDEGLDELRDMMSAGLNNPQTIKGILTATNLAQQQ